MERDANDGSDLGALIRAAAKPPTCAPASSLLSPPVGSFPSPSCCSPQCFLLPSPPPLFRVHPSLGIHTASTSRLANTPLGRERQHSDRAAQHGEHRGRRRCDRAKCGCAAIPLRAGTTAARENHHERVRSRLLWARNSAPSTKGLTCKDEWAAAICWNCLKYGLNCCCSVPSSSIGSAFSSTTT